ncbi:Activator of 2-hydroxyglutaryl-CoA dehydratase [Olavius sp. associated proteobacterium Delta 1]|nr:Activator of 2-hydroxyglutaryl-CoA dehydratase [Olavius sp. associated proteobacterium Delta 1]
MSAYPHILGVDIGSVSISVVALDSRQKIIGSAYEFHHGNTARTLKEILEQFELTAVGGIAATAVTPAILKVTQRYDSQIAVLRAANFQHDRVGSILVVGGEKFGLLRLDESGNYLGFKSNTGCAAGTGSFLDQQAQRLNLSSAAELSRIALSNKGPVPKIASRCAVFAKTDLVHAQQEGCTLAQICDGLCLGLARNIFDTLFTAEDFHGPIIFTGGVSLNRSVVKHLGSLTGKVIITDGTLMHGAVGAALSLADEYSAPASGGLQSVDDLLIPPKAGLHYFHDPLELTLSDYPEFGGLESYRHRAGDVKNAADVEVDVYQDLKHFRHLTAYLGIDVGSTSTKAVLIDRNKTVVAGFYTRTAGKPVAAVQVILAAIGDMVLKNGIDLNIIGSGTTGAGRKFIGKIIGADITIDEITTHARAAVEIDPRVDTIIEIGGQDSKFTTLQNGRVTFVVMNNVCAAGTGSFIEEQAQKLNCPLSQYSVRAAHRKSPMASDRCTVFMERDLNHYLNAGYPVDDMLAAVLHSVRENYLTKVADESSIGNVISFQGATAKNKALVAAFEKRLGKPIKVSRYCHLTGALGTALMIFDQAIPATRFRGLDLYKKNIPLRSETCDLCTNHCKLTVAEIDGVREAYGFLCGRDYDTKHYVNNNRAGFDLLKERARVFALKGANEYKEAFTIGIPAALHLLEDLPFWRFFFNELGIKTVTGQSRKDSLKDGKRLAGAEFCAPMTALYSHVSGLLDRSDFIFLPFYLDKKGRAKGPRRQYCYYTQFAPSLNSDAGGSQNRKKFLMPVVHYLYSNFYTKSQLYWMLRGICRHRISYFEISSAYDRAAEFMKACRAQWRAAYQRHSGRIDNLHVVLLGRPYNVLTGAMHKGIPNILAALGVKTFFQDMLSYSPEDVKTIQPLLDELHWHFAAKILEAAEVIAQSPGAYPILMTAFKCSPDSFVIDYFKKIMDSHDKPYLILQLDDHDSTGGYETRIEAAIRSFHNHRSLTEKRMTRTDLPPLVATKSRHLLNRTLILPNWDPITCNLIAANLNRAGIDARCLEETPASIQQSMRFNSGQCIPLNIVAQEFIDYVQTHGLDPARTALWMSVGEIACNIKLYPHYIKNILASYGNGLEQADVYLGALSMLDISVTLPLNNYFAYMFGGMIRKIGCKIRPYERHKGDTDQVIAAAVAILCDALAGNRSKAAAVDEVVSSLEAIETMDPTLLPPRPKVAIFGDLYTRDNSVINQDLIHFIEDNGGEVITTPYSEYLKMVSRPYLRKWLIEGRYLSAISSQALMATLKRKEKIYYTYFERILNEPEPEYNEPAKDVLARYNVRLENTGESLDNLLKIHYIKKHYPDVALFVQASPAFCCPALVTEAMGNVIERITNTPVVSITYDGTGGSKNDVIIPYLKYPRRESRRDKDNFGRHRLRMGS